MQASFDDMEVSENPVSVAATLGYSLDFVKGRIGLMDASSALENSPEMKVESHTGWP